MGEKKHSEGFPHNIAQIYMFAKHIELSIS